MLRSAGSGIGRFLASLGAVVETTSRGVAIGRISVIGVRIRGVAIGRTSVIGVRIRGRIPVVICARGIPRAHSKAGATEAKVNSDTLGFRRTQWKRQGEQS